MAGYQTFQTGILDVKTQVDNYLSEVKKTHNIPGMALAVIQNEKLIYQSYMGKASLEKNTKVNKNTLFRIFSATKLITSVAVFQLIERRQLKLSDSIETYLPDIPTKWRHIKIENLLTHSSGLPDLVAFKSELNDSDLLKKLYDAPIEFELGKQFSYNQTNYWLLAEIIEKITGSSFASFVLENQFDNNSQEVMFSSDSNQLILNRATRYNYNSKNKAFDKDTNNSGARGHSGNGLNITLNQFIEWNRKLDKNLLINDSSKMKMWSHYEYTNKEDKFMYGWKSYPVNGIESVGFSGGNLAGFRKFINHDTTVIFLSNGYQTPVYDTIINDILRMTVKILKNQDLALEADVMTLILERDYDKAQTAYSLLKDQNPESDFSNLNWNINSLGNVLQYIENNKEEAVKAFQFNVQANPDWWVSMASFAEIQESLRNFDIALSYYQKAIQLNNKNEWNYNSKMTEQVSLLKKKLNSSEVN
ncbi:serine hydrolase domain-containing protein [Marinicella rhabdoformis]|uniref:serine hydrolase domain-containing protein n=1 Tax=Marinicella rhabdoformis TaxID=2580566 RepID=UPI0024833BD7|nr:serine hydrolase [Marinicella rhabdoformis]